MPSKYPTRCSDCNYCKRIGAKYSCCRLSMGITEVVFQTRSAYCPYTQSEKVEEREQEIVSKSNNESLVRLMKYINSEICATCYSKGKCCENCEVSSIKNEILIGMEEEAKEEEMMRKLLDELSSPDGLERMIKALGLDKKGE